MCLTLSPCEFAGSRLEMISSLRIFVYLLCSAFSRFVTVPCKTISLGRPEVARFSWAQLTSSITEPNDSSRKQKLFAGTWFGKTLWHWVHCTANCSAVQACVYWGVNAELLGIGPRTDVMMSESKETGRKEQKKKALFRLLSSWLGNQRFQNLGTGPKCLLPRKSRKQYDLWRKQTYLFFHLPILQTIAVCRQIILRSASVDQCREWFPSTLPCQTHWMVCNETGPWTSSQHRRYLSRLSCTCFCSCSHSPHLPVLDLAGRSEGKGK